MPRASRPSVRPSTTSPRAGRDAEGGDAELLALLDGVPDALRRCVFAHPSFAVVRSQSYERLEFLGDSVLELAIAGALYDRFPESPEGELTRLRATIVSRASCAVVGRRLGLGERLRQAGEAAGAEENLERLAATRSVAAAVLEAALGALFLTYGLERIAGTIVAVFGDRLDEALAYDPDAKTALQEALARLGRSVEYTVVRVEGPAHDRRFTCAAVVAGEVAGVGSGASKKAAEQIAARQALERLDAAS